MSRVLAHTGVKYPIMQAPMGWIARSQLASAVSNAGGLGVIETSSGEVDRCLAEIAKMKELTTKPFGVNLPLLFIRDPQLVDLVAASGVKFVTTSAGSPTLKAAGLKAIVDVGDTGTVMLNRKSTPCVRALKTERAKAIDRDGSFDRGPFKNVKEVYFGGDM